jgi:hypothetical protein
MGEDAVSNRSTIQTVITKDFVRSAAGKRPGGSHNIDLAVLQEPFLVQGVGQENTQPA